MDEVFQRLMESAGVPPESHEATLAKLRSLKRLYPNETPARLFARARKEGAPIPVSRCLHGVARGQCVSCDSKIGARKYYTPGGRFVHARPTCDDLRSADGGDVGPIEVVVAGGGPADGREPCARCLPARTARVARPRPASASRPAAAAGATRPRQVLGQGPVPLAQSSPPNVGDDIEWGGFTGTVTEVTDAGVRLAVGAIKMTAPWGDRARVRRRSG